MLWYAVPDPDPDQVIDVNDDSILSVYLHSLDSLPTAPGEISSLSTAAIVGIIVAAVVLILSVVVILIVIICFCNRRKQSSSL